MNQNGYSVVYVVGIICDYACHFHNCEWMASCSSGQIYGTLSRGNQETCNSLIGLVNRNDFISFRYGNTITQGIKAQDE